MLSRDESYAVRNDIIISSVTRRVRGIPTEVRLGPEDGLPQECVTNVDSIATIRKSRLLNRISLLSVDKMREVEEAVRFALDLPQFARDSPPN